MATFDIVGEQFLDYYDLVRGAVRTDVTRHNLQPYLPELPATAIDIGGGDGRDASWLASLGYAVTLVDESPVMLEKAQHSFQELGQKVITILGNSDTILDEIAGKYDVVLSHGVLMYCLDRPQHHVDVLAELVAPRGIVSVLTKGFKGALSRFEDINSDQAKELLKTHQVVNNLGELTWAFTPNELNGMLRKNKLTVEDWFGVRIISEKDKRRVKDLPDGEYHEILEKEIELSHAPQKRKFGQMLHSIARA